MKTTGFIILIIGFALTIFTTFTYFTNRKVVDLGSVVITKEMPHSLNWSPFIGLAVMTVGGFLILQAKKK